MSHRHEIMVSMFGILFFREERLEELLDKKLAHHNRHLEETMTQLSEQVNALTTAVEGVATRVSAEIADLETKITDPDTVVTAADLAGIKGATDQLNSIAATPAAPAEPGDDTPAPPVDGTTTDTTVDGGTDAPAENTPPEGADRKS